MKPEGTLVEVGSDADVQIDSSDLGIAAKDPSNHLVAGSRRNFPQDSRRLLKDPREVKQMIRSPGASAGLHSFSNSKCARNPCYLIEHGRRVWALSGPLLVSRTGDAE